MSKTKSKKASTRRERVALVRKIRALIVDLSGALNDLELSFRDAIDTTPCDNLDRVVRLERGVDLTEEALDFIEKVEDMVPLTETVL